MKTVVAGKLYRSLFDIGSRNLKRGDFVIALRPLLSRYDAHCDWDFLLPDGTVNWLAVEDVEEVL